MRWDLLFDDLEARFEAGESAAAAAELADLTRAEVAGVTLAARLEAQVGGRLGWWLGSSDEARIDAALLELGSDWVLLAQGRRELLVPLDAVCGLTGLARMAVVDPDPDPDPDPGAGTPGGTRAAGATGGRVSVARRLGMGTVLRRLARDRVQVSLRLSGGRGDVTGTIDRVARDHLDLAEHAAGEFRRAAAVLQVRTVPWRALVWVAVSGS